MEITNDSKKETNLFLYHISSKVYQPGEKILIEDKTEYYKRKEGTHDNWVDDLLDSSKPNGYLGRQKALYAFDSLENCEKLIGSDKRFNEQKHFYLVEMKNPIRVPMCLVNILLKGGIDSLKNDAIINEYWEPQQSWKCFEYVSNEMIIIQEVEAPKNSMLLIKAQSDYFADIDLGKKFVNSINI
jgi:hypothetical protein